VELDLKKYSSAATVAALVPAGFVKMADRGTENERRYNKFFATMNQELAYVIALPYRTMNDPRTKVVDAGVQSSLPGQEQWVTNKYPSLGSPIRLASWQEAQLILAEAQVQQGQVAQGQQTINAYRATYSLPALTFTSQADAMTKIIEERRRELSFEGSRLNDLLRFNIPWKIGASPIDANPYGQTTCWPFPAQERSGV
jgi:hypothetical protein